MKNKYSTQQEGFWAGEFGDAYTERNVGLLCVASNLALFAKILARTSSISSIIEFGANRGLNLHALKQLKPSASFQAVEINEKAAGELKKLDWLEVHHQSLLDFKAAKLSDLVLIKGVLIHLNPEVLPQVYELLYQSSSKYICLVEYYNPTPIAVPYRGHEDRLFKRDFAGEMMKKFNDLKLVDYGFVYHADCNFPQDDVTWFVLEKCK
jgi:spore coat polysaccharide biosynthesis protein SpsF